MTQLVFDKCPKCGSEGTFGLRCHPKWSIKVGIVWSEYSDMVAYYAHDEDSAKALYDVLNGTEGMTILGVDHWGGDKWVGVVW